MPLQRSGPHPVKPNPSINRTCPGKPVISNVSALCHRTCEALCYCLALWVWWLAHFCSPTFRQSQGRFLVGWRCFLSAFRRGSRLSGLEQRCLGHSSSLGFPVQCAFFWRSRLLPQSWFWPLSLSGLSSVWLFPSRVVARALTWRSTSLPSVAGRCAIKPRSAG